LRLETFINVSAESFDTEAVATYAFNSVMTAAERKLLRMLLEKQNGVGGLRVGNHFCNCRKAWYYPPMSSWVEWGLALVTSVFAGTSGTVWFSPPEVDWRVRTDKSERPDIGLSTLELEVDDAVRTQGLLYALPGKKKGKVGFALIEAPEPVDATAFREVCFGFNGGPRGAHFQVLLKDDQAEQPDGTLTFQSDFVASGEAQDLCLPLSNFVAHIRGAKVSDFVLNKRSLRSFSVQISRSRLEEPLYSQSPLGFQFGLQGDVRLR